MSFPDPNTSYYIRNRFTGKYLTFDSSYYEHVYASDKIADKNHQWIFVNSGVSTFALRTSALDVYVLCVGNPTGAFGGSGNAITANTRQFVTFAADPNANGYFNIIVNNFVTSFNSYYLNAQENIVNFIVQNNTNPLSQEPARRQWVLEPKDSGPLPLPWPVTPVPTVPGVIDNGSLPQGILSKGIYRIRTFIGNYLLTMPREATGLNASVYVSQQVPKENFQQWLVTPQANGLYTISNSGNTLYLAGSTSNLAEGTTLIGQSAPFPWKIKTSDSGIFFFISLQDPNLSIGFPNYDAEDLQVVSLEPSDKIPSQIWFFEKFTPISAASFHGKRVLEAGTYTLECCDNNQWLKVLDSGDLSLDVNRFKAIKVIVAYADSTSPSFTISYKDSYGTSYLTANNDRVNTTDLQQRATQWVVLALERQSDDGTAYNICDASSQSSRQAFSSRRIIDRNRSYFALDPLADQEVKQMWRFRSA